MQMIVAVDRRWAIGNKGSLLVSIPADHRMFREKTEGKILIYGRKTLATFPLQQPLSGGGRRNLVLSGNLNYTVRGAEVVHSIEELLACTQDEDPDDLMVIGGASVYRQLLPYCDLAFVTKVDRVYEADAFCPNLDEDPQWELFEEGEEQTCFDLTYAFLTYRRKIIR